MWHSGSTMKTASAVMALATPSRNPGSPDIVAVSDFCLVLVESSITPSLLLGCRSLLMILMMVRTGVRVVGRANHLRQGLAPTGNWAILTTLLHEPR